MSLQSGNQFLFNSGANLYSTTHNSYVKKHNRKCIIYNKKQKFAFVLESKNTC